jgi:hypothetical protein
VRDIITNSLSPRLASQAPKDKRIILSKFIFMRELERYVGVNNTNLSIRASKVSRVINRCVCCEMMAIKVINGIKVSIKIIDLRYLICC